MQVKQYKKMRYWECLPDDFDENKKYPFYYICMAQASAAKI